MTRKIGIAAVFASLALFGAVQAASAGGPSFLATYAWTTTKTNP